MHKLVTTTNWDLVLRSQKEAVQRTPDNAGGAETDDETGGKSDKTNHLFHDNSFSNRFEVVKTENGN